MTTLIVILVHESDCWTITQKTVDRIQVFVLINKCLRRILNIHWPERITI